MMPEHDENIASLARALRESTRGKVSGPDATRAAVLRSRAPKRADRVVWLAAAAALLMMISVPSAWALYTGYFTSPPQGPTPDVVPASRVVGAPAPVLPPAVEAVAEHEPELPSEALELVEEEPAAAEVRRLTSRNRPVNPAERVAYEAAHALHFEAHDSRGALSAWDAYLARYPQGRFAPEAHYNRALTLVRLGRREEALIALEPFENGVFGAYRQQEASELRAAIGDAP